MLQHKDLVEFLKNTTELANDQTAVKAMNLYPIWKVGESVSVGERVQHEGKLYKCKTAHVTQENWKPSQDTASIWEVIDVEHAGTTEDPIPYNLNMEVFKDRYYAYESVLYKCIRDSEQPLQNTPDQLIDIYFVTANR